MKHAPDLPLEDYLEARAKTLVSKIEDSNKDLEELKFQQRVLDQRVQNTRELNTTYCKELEKLKRIQNETS